MADYAIHDTTLIGTSNIIRKKEGSSALIDPADYPKRINLMGMLEEKTQASASVCAFSDGADDVPTKSLVVTIPPTLTGVSSVTETQTGSNVWDEVWELGEINVTNGQNVANNNFIRSTNYIPVLPNTVYYKCAPQNYLQLYYGKDKSYLSYGSWNKNTTFTTPSDCYFVRFYVASEYGTTYNNDIALNYPSTFTEYAHYNGTTYTASLGRTIYGGEVDIVNGVGQDYALWVDMSTINWTEDPNRLGVFYGAVTGRKTATADEPSDVLDCTCYTVNNVNVTTGTDKYISGARSYGGIYIFFRDSAFSGYTREHVQEALQGEKVCVVSANPTDFTFEGQEIPTRLGYNAFWSEQGDTSVAYRASGTIYNYPRGEEASF